MNTNNNFFVSIRCMTFNHKSYIQHCLDGFVMQKTNFRFEAIVHDDASTDGTQDIIREYAEKYPDIIKPIYETENQYSKHDGSLRRVIDSAMSPTSKYVALCEGDDYWIDPLKLQKQVDFLESHPNYSMCYHAVNYVSDDIVIGNDKRFENECDVSTEQMIEGGGGFCATCSLVYRKEFLYNKPSYFKIAKVGDAPLQVFLATSGKIHYFPALMGTYRKNVPGSWSSRVWEKDRTIPYLNAIEWLLAFNKETNSKYEKSVLKRIYPYICFLIDHSAIDKKKKYSILNHFSITSLYNICGKKELLLYVLFILRDFFDSISTTRIGK